MTATPRASVAPTADAQLKGFVAKFDPEHQTMIRAVRKRLRAFMPTAVEMVYDNYNFFVIGYGAADRPSAAVLSLTAASNGIGVCFIQGAKLPDPQNLLVGTGKQTRSIHIDSVDVLDRPAVKALIKAAIARSEIPFATSGKNQLIIRSVSAKQRPRRK